MPDLSKHANFMAEFLRENKDVYDRLKDKKTASGVTLAHCIKTGPPPHTTIYPFTGADGAKIPPNPVLVVLQ